jgi:homogentisate 1,2-dioxygenase
VIYHSLGSIPKKRHIQFRRPDGELYSEELFGAEGFDSNSSLLYHTYPPTMVSKVESGPEVKLERWDVGVLRHHHLRTKDIAPGGDPVTSRKVVLFNNDVILSVARPNESMEYFYRNGEHDELVFMHEGSGVVRSSFGTLPFEPWDYVYIPRGTTYQIDFETKQNRMFVIEASGPIGIPRRYRTKLGQFMENSPFCERDIRLPELPLTYNEDGLFEVRIKKLGRLHRYWFEHHPLDVVGWDGYHYPWTFNIKNFEPITGRIHQPPPVHQTFEGPNFVVCSFVPRLFDYHPDSIPAPYVHSNIDSDEVLYYVDGDFMSRRGVEYASITEHPGGIPHGPHPGKAEESIGKLETHEYAVMVDTFKPLFMAKDAQAMDVDTYPYSWKDVDPTAHR